MLVTEIRLNESLRCRHPLVKGASEFGSGNTVADLPLSTGNLPKVPFLLNAANKEAGGVLAFKTFGYESTALNVSNYLLSGLTENRIKVVSTIGSKRPEKRTTHLN